MNTINEVNTLAEELKQGSVQKFNQATRGTVQQLFGNTPQSDIAARYVTAVSTLKEEMANLVQRGAACPTAHVDIAIQMADETAHQRYPRQHPNTNVS